MALIPFVSMICSLTYDIYPYRNQEQNPKIILMNSYPMNHTRIQDENENESVPELAVGIVGRFVGM